MFSIEDRNYYSDYRVRAGERAGKLRMVGRNMAEVTIHYDDDTEEVVTVPIRMEVCPTCDGEGTHVNPSIDSGGLSAEDFADDPDFAEEYFSGRYDVLCYECGGKRVVPTIDESRTPDAILGAIHRQEDTDAAYASERAYERRMGM